MENHYIAGQYWKIALANDSLMVQTKFNKGLVK